MRFAKHHAWLCAGLIALASTSTSASSVKFDSNAESGQTTLSWSGHGSHNSRFSFEHYRLPVIDSTDLTLFMQNRASSKGHKKSSNESLQTKTSTDRRFEFDNDEGKYSRDRFSWSHNRDVRFDDHLFGLDHSHIKHHAELHDVQVTPTPEPQSVVPVPAAFWLLGSGLIALIGAARRR